MGNECPNGQEPGRRFVVCDPSLPSSTVPKQLLICDKYSTSPTAKGRRNAGKQRKAGERQTSLRRTSSIFGSWIWFWRQRVLEGIYKRILYSEQNQQLLSRQYDLQHGPFVLFLIKMFFLSFIYLTLLEVNPTKSGVVLGYYYGSPLDILRIYDQRNLTGLCYPSGCSSNGNSNSRL